MVPSATFPWATVRRERIYLHIVLFLLTLLTTTIVGAGLAASFYSNQPANLDQDLEVAMTFWQHPSVLLSGLPFALTLLTILFSHEMGHYLTCLRYQIDASLPYFLPAPSLIGTLGAFIRIRSPIYTRKALFDVGVAGPIAGFCLLVPFLFVGVFLSRVLPGVGSHGDFIFGTPLLLRAFEMLVFPGVPIHDINLHPIARAAWSGMLATALNLLPIGQLDGGHILYAFFGRQHKSLSRVFVAALIPLGFYSYTWFGLAALLLIFGGLRHPVIFDIAPLGATRTALGWFALLMFVLCFTPTPITGGS